MKKILFGISLLSLFVLFGCQKNNPESCPINGTGYSCSVETGNQNLDEIEKEILTSLKEKKIDKLIEYAGKDGIRFSPYENVNTGIDVVLKSSELSGYFNSGMSIERGSYDGSGEPILLTMAQYRNKFIYDQDFLNAPEKFVNQKKQRGNTTNNIFDIYRGATVVEYYFSGFDAQYQGMDWESLILIFEKQNSEWKLIGVSHGQWTI